MLKSNKIRDKKELYKFTTSILTEDHIIPFNNILIAPLNTSHVLAIVTDKRRMLKFKLDIDDIIDFQMEKCHNGLLSMVQTGKDIKFMFVKNDYPGTFQQMEEITNTVPKHHAEMKNNFDPEFPGKIILKTGCLINYHWLSKLPFNITEVFWSTPESPLKMIGKDNIGNDIIYVVMPMKQ